MVITQPIGLLGSEDRLNQSEERTQHCVELLKAMAHPIRLRIVGLLAGGAQHVSAISEQLDLAQAAISQQLRILRMRGLVQVTRSGGFAHYSLRDPRFVELLRCIDGVL
jgi:DNA-binding transcriptional ArsR family regulator